MDQVLKYLWAAAILISLLVGLGFFSLSWYHGFMMFMNRSGHWTGYYLPFGFLCDAALNKKGIYHRSKMLRYLAIAAPFMMILAVYALLNTR
jgi:hypothetical protein